MSIRRLLGTAAAMAAAALLADPDAAHERGEALAKQLGCAACHSPDGATSVGPTWQGLFGRTRPLADGSEVTADEAYIRESIVDPNAKVAEGFSPGIMPQDFGERLSDDEIRSLIEYIKTLDGG